MTQFRKLKLWGYQEGLFLQYDKQNTHTHTHTHTHIYIYIYIYIYWDYEVSCFLPDWPIIPHPDYLSFHQKWHNDLSRVREKHEQLWLIVSAVGSSANFPPTAPTNKYWTLSIFISFLFVYLFAWLHIANKLLYDDCHLAFERDHLQRFLATITDDWWTKRRFLIRVKEWQPRPQTPLSSPYEVP